MLGVPANNSAPLATASYGIKSLGQLVCGSVVIWKVMGIEAAWRQRGGSVAVWRQRGSVEAVWLSG